MRKRRLLRLLLLIAAVAGAAWAFFYGRERVPSGQPPLVRLDEGTLHALRDRFNAAAAEPRLLAILSPT